MQGFYFKLNLTSSYFRRFLTWFFFTKCHSVSKTKVVKHKNPSQIFCFAFVLTQFFRHQTVEQKCFQIYMSNLGIMGGPFCSFTKSLIVNHSTCIHLHNLKSLPIISKPCILGYIECRTENFRRQNSSNISSPVCGTQG